MVIPPGLAIQFYLLLISGVAFAYWPPARAWFVRLPGVHRTILCGLLGAMLAGNFAADPRAWYPFVRWDIFSFLREEDPITCRELWATTAGGRGVRLLAEQLFPSIVQFDLPPSQGPGPMTRLVAALAGEYNRLHPGDPVQQVDLVRISVNLHPARPGKPACEILRHYDVSSARSP